MIVKPTKPKTPTVAGDIRPNPNNPRSITPEQLDVLGRCLVTYGDISGIVYNVRTGNCVGGHQRLTHIDPSWAVTKTPHTDNAGTVALGYIETPWGKFNYREVDWSAQKEVAGNIAANKVGGDWEYGKVAHILNDIDGKIDLELTGFDAQEIDDLMNGLLDPVIDEPTDEDKADAQQDNPATCPKCGFKL